MNDRPPEGFEAVPGVALPNGSRACPDLTGTFDLAGTPLAAAITERAPPPTHGLPVVLSFKQGPTNMEAWWVVPRASLLAFANDLRADAPKRYTRWRDLVLKEHMTERFRYDFDAYLSAVTELGPPGPVYAGIVSRGCEENWMRASSITVSVDPPDGSTEPRGQQEREIWLARDRHGALLVRRATYKLATYSIWAPSTQSIRTSGHARYERVALAAPEDPAPLAAAELKPDPRTEPRPQMTCAEAPARMAQFSQRLISALPPKAELTRFALQPRDTRGATPDCRYLTVELGIVGSGVYTGARIDDWLRADPDVRSVEALPLQQGERHEYTRRLRVVLH